MCHVMLMPMAMSAVLRSRAWCRAQASIGCMLGFCPARLPMCLAPDRPCVGGGACGVLLTRPLTHRSLLLAGQVGSPIFANYGDGFATDSACPQATPPPSCFSTPSWPSPTCSRLCWPPTCMGPASHVSSCRPQGRCKSCRLPELAQLCGSQCSMAKWSP